MRQILTLSLRSFILVKLGFIVKILLFVNLIKTKVKEIYLASIISRQSLLLSWDIYLHLTTILGGALCFLLIRYFQVENIVPRVKLLY